jgi:hypothetical protein
VLAQYLTALAVVVSVFAQLFALYQLRRSLDAQARQSDKEHARRLAAEQLDRLRRAYAALHRAVALVDEAFSDLMFYPAGHPYLGNVTGSVSDEFLRHNRFDFVQSRWERAREVSAEAEAVIELDHQEDAALAIYERLDDEFYDLYVASIEGRTPQDAPARRERFLAGVKELQAAARDKLASIAAAVPA